MTKKVGVFLIKRLWDLRGGWLIIFSILIPMLILTKGNLQGIVDVSDYKEQQRIEQRLLEEEQAQQEFIASLEEWILNQKFYIGKHNFVMPPEYAKEYAAAIATSKYPILCTAVFKVESMFNPFSVSTAGAIGPAQIMPFHVEELKKSNIIDRKSDLLLIKNAVQAFDYMIEKKLNSKRGNKEIKKALYLYSGETPGYVDKVSKEMVKIQAHFVRSSS